MSWCEKHKERNDTGHFDKIVYRKRFCRSPFVRTIQEWCDAQTVDRYFVGGFCIARRLDMILVIGGITEAKELCKRLSKREHVLLSVATEYGAELAANGGFEIITGRKDTAEFQKLLDSRNIRLVIDCSHPFAENVSQQIRKAAQQADIPLLCYRRTMPEYAYQRIVKLYNFTDAIGKTKNLCRTGKVFLAIGSNHIPEFTEEILPNQLVARVLDRKASVDICLNSGIPKEQILAKRGPFSVQDNLSDFQRFSIDVVVTKESGAAGGTPEKVKAAELLGLPLVLVCPSVPAYDSVDALYRAAVSMK